MPLHPGDELLLRDNHPVADFQGGEICFMHQLIGAGRCDSQYFRHRRRVQKQRQLIIAFVGRFFHVSSFIRVHFSVCILSFRKTPPIFSCTIFTAFVRKILGHTKNISLLTGIKIAFSTTCFQKFRNFSAIQNTPYLIRQIFVF